MIFRKYTAASLASGLFRGNIDFSVRSIGLPAFWSEEAAE